MSVSFSTTKGVTATALHVLVDRGLLDYDDPVARVLAASSRREGKERITVRQLLCHQAGLYGIRDLIDDAARMRDWEPHDRRAGAHAPAMPPGLGQRLPRHHLTAGWSAR